MTAEPPSSVESQVATPGDAFRAAGRSVLLPSPRLRELALAAVARLVLREDAAPATSEAAFLQRQISMVTRAGSSWDEVFSRSCAHPAAADEGLVRLALELEFSALELLTVALAAAIEEDPMTGRALAHVQAPVGGSRPTLGLIMTALGRLAGDVPPAGVILNGPAVRCGLLVVLNETAPLPERPLTVPPSLCLALTGHDVPWPGATLGIAADRVVPLAPRVLRQAKDHAHALRVPGATGLMIRCASPAEGRTAAAALARSLELRPLFLEGDTIAGLGPFLALRACLPIFNCELAPGERRVLPRVTRIRRSTRGAGRSGRRYRVPSGVIADLGTPNA